LFAGLEDDDVDVAAVESLREEPRAKPHLSVVVCTHNPRPDYLARTVDGLRRQSVAGTDWEFLIIDNASQTPVAADLAAWHPRGRVVREERLGLTNARLRGIADSSAPLILFVDDDNILREDYLEQVLRIHARLPMLGCFGAAVITPEYEEQPAAELLPYMSMLALRNASQSRWSNDPHDPFTPWGAGLVVTRRVAEAVAESVRGDPLKEQLGRTGRSLNSCEDEEFSLAACRMDGGRGVFTELQLTHLIPRGRVQKPYLLRLAEGNGYSRTLLWHLHGQDRSVVRPLAPFTQLVRLAVTRRGRGLGTEVMHYLRFLSQDATRREFRQATWRGVQRARQVIAGEDR
jgi:glycosyltransferase involved in cell wall biosynthesis